MTQLAPSTAATDERAVAPPHRRPGLPAPMWVALAVGVACTLTLAVAAIPGVRPRTGVIPLLDDWVQTTGYVAAAAMGLGLALRARRFAALRFRVLWWVVAAALALRGYGFFHSTFVLDRAPVYPSLADAAWVASGVLLVVAAIEVARYHLPDHARTLVLDAVLGGVTAVAVAVTLLSGTIGRLAPGDLDRDVLFVNLAYPILDVCLLTVVAGLLGLTHGRVSVGVATTCLGVVLIAVVDAVFLYQVTHGSFRPGSVLSSVSLLGTLLVPLGGWLPRRRPPQTHDSLAGLTLPVLLTLVCLGVLAADAVQPVPPAGIVLASAGVVVAIFRAGITYTGDRRSSQATIAEKAEEMARFRALVDASSDFIGIGDLDGTVVYINPAGRERIGLGADEPLGDLSIGDTLHEADRIRAEQVERPQIMAQGFWRGESTLRHQRGGPDTPVMKNTFLVRHPDTGKPWVLSTIQRDISDIKAAQADLQRLADERQELLRHLVEAQEAERSRIAADVHDDPVQVMAAVDLQLGLVERLLQTGADPEETLALVARMRGTVSEANDRLRYLLFDLDSPAQREDVETALGEAAAYVLGDAVRWDVRCEPDLDLDETARVLVYRIAKEAMVNVRKHAQATRVHIDVRRLEGGVEVTVSDDGVGLPPDEPTTRPGHRGVSDMRDRAAIAGGSVTLRNGDERGAVMRLWVPVSHRRD